MSNERKDSLSDGRERILLEADIKFGGIQRKEGAGE